MNYFDKKWFKIFRVIRVIIYLCLFISFIIIDTEYFLNHHSTCLIYNKFGLLCPSCGVTRAFSSICHFKFGDALNFNPIFTLAICPICVFLFLDEIIRTISQMITKKYKYTILEYLIVGMME